VAKENLWNIGDRNPLKQKKTRMVIEFLNKLQPLTNTWGFKQIAKFNKEIEKAKSCSTANEMLEIIGYEPGKRPKFYDTIDDMGMM